MTVRLLAAYTDPNTGKRYKVGNLLTTDAATETGLVNAKQADTNLAGGTAWVDDDTTRAVYPVQVENNRVTGGIGFVLPNGRTRFETLGSNFPLRATTAETLAPQDANGVETATFGAGLTAAQLWATRGCGTVGNAANRLFQLSKIINIANSVELIAFKYNSAVAASGTAFLMGTSNQGASDRGWYWGVNTSGVPRLFVKGGTSATSVWGSGTVADGTDHTVLMCIDGVNKGAYCYIDGILELGVSSGAWTGDAHSDSLTQSLCVGAQYPGGNSALSAKFANLCRAVLPSVPLNLNAVAAAYHGNPGAGLVGVEL